MALIAPDRRVKILNMALSGEKGQRLCLMFGCAFRRLGLKHGYQVLCMQLQI